MTMVATASAAAGRRLDRATPRTMSHSTASARADDESRRFAQRSECRSRVDHP
jgi:hypothetical protein